MKRTQVFSIDIDENDVDWIEVHVDEDNFEGEPHIIVTRHCQVGDEFKEFANCFNLVEAQAVGNAIISLITELSLRVRT